MSYLTEKEQIAIFTKWWNDNATALIVSITLVLGAYFGWQAWQKHQQTRSEQASAIFQQILDARSGRGDTSVDVAALAATIKKDYADTFYAQAARLLLAETSVKSGDLSAAEKELTELVADKPDDAMLTIARMRLARVLYAQSKYDLALAQLEKAPAAAYLSMFAELRGDILLAQAKPDLARTAYNESIAALKEGDAEQKQVIEMKLNSIAVSQ